MRIIDKNADYYDFWQGVYRDDSITFDRTDSFALTKELVCDDMCFLYGDTIYDRKVLAAIAESHPDDILFYGNSKSVVAVRIGDAELFREHFDRVRTLFVDGTIEKCKGWQVYQSVTGQDLTQKPVIGDKFVLVDEHTTDINTPEEYRNI